MPKETFMFRPSFCRAVAIALLAVLPASPIAPLAQAGEDPARATVSGTAVALSGSCGAAPRPGTVCTAPQEAAADADLLLWAIDGKSENVPVRTNAAGEFRVELRPGSYEVRPAGAPSPWVVEPLQFSVNAGETARIVIRLRLLRQ